MKSFSQRYGYKKIREQIQRESIDSILRNQLWNIFAKYYFRGLKNFMGKSSNYPFIDTYLKDNYSLQRLCSELWHNYFIEPLDTLNNGLFDVYNYIRIYYMQCKWNEVYDLIEFVANNYWDEVINQKFIDECNSVFGKQLSAYRFVGTKIVELTSEQEIKEIEEAVQSSPPPAQIHLNESLDKLSNRTNPDYRNSIKESISAVEAVCRIILKDNDITLGRALNRIEDTGKIEFNKDLKEGFKKIYHYTSSDKSGIRHSMMAVSELDAEDAKFMLVSCSTFINYLIVKADKAGIKMDIQKQE